MTWDIAGLVVLVMALSQWIKTRMGWTGPQAEVMSFAVGLVIGALFWYATHPPTTIQDWVVLLLFSLGMALVPSGLFKFFVQLRNGFHDSTTLRK